MPELPVLDRAPVCPAALKIDGACASQQGIVCREMQRDVDDESGVGMEAGQLGFLQHEATGGVYLNLESDPSSVTGFCYGDALPVLSNDDDKRLARASYTRCVVWQAARDRHLAGERGLYDEAEPEPVSMGVSSADADDPWARARADLDLLA